MLKLNFSSHFKTDRQFFQDLLKQPQIVSDKRYKISKRHLNFLREAGLRSAKEVSSEPILVFGVKIQLKQLYLFTEIFQVIEKLTDKFLETASSLEKNRDYSKKLEEQLEKTKKELIKCQIEKSEIKMELIDLKNSQLKKTVKASRRKAVLSSFTSDL